MYPIICQIGPVTIYSYGVMLAVAACVCAFLLAIEARRFNISGDIIVDLVFWVLIGGLIGCRLFFIILNLPYYFQHPAEIVMIQKGGLAWQGGLIFGTVAGLIFMKKEKLPVLKTLDILAPYVALGQAIGRMGCFFNGCCYGRHVDWGIFFPSHNDTLHPTQGYSTLGLLVIFFILKRYQNKERISGKLFILYLVLASLLRFAVEFFRADHVSLIFGLSIFQVVTIGILLLAIYANFSLKSRPGK